MTSATHRSPGRAALALLSALALALTLLPPITSSASAQASGSGADLVLSQVYGGGGNAGAPFTNDFAEVFNAGHASVELSGLSVQYASATGAGNFGANTGLRVSLTGSLAPGQYHLVELASGGANGEALPTPDTTGTINAAGASGKFALVTGTDSLGCNGSEAQPCSAEQLERIVDLVGYGSANFFEGSGAAPTLSNSTAAFRADDGCTDTDDNAADFTADSPAPRNSASPTNPCADPVGPIVVMSQGYGAGGNAGAVLTNDYIELFNRGDAPADVAGWTLRYASATGSSWLNNTVLPAGASIPPGGYYLVQLAGGANGEPLPTADATGTINMAGSNGKIALFTTNADVPTSTCPTGFDSLVDFIGFGTANCFEGDGPAPAPSTTNAIFRADDGCTDTDDNAADFTADSPAPRNSASPANPCAGGGDQPPVNQPVVPACEDLTVTAGEGGAVELSASDADGTVVTSSITGGATEGVTLVNEAPATELGGTYTVDVAVDEALAVGTYGLDVTFSNDDPEPQTADCTVTVTVQGDVCAVPETDLTPINAIQGSGSATPLDGQPVVTRGVVTSAFPSGGATGIPNNHGLRGFFIEAIAADRDDDPQTSEGLFVFDFAGVYDSELGDLVYVAGTAGESFTITQVSSDTFATCDGVEVDTTLPPPAELPLPVAPTDRNEVLEPLESMRVSHPELTLVEFFQLERFGDVRVSSGGIFDNPTNVVDPRDDDAYNAIVDFNAANNIVLSSGRTAQNINRPGPEGTPPLPFLEPGDTLRIGDQLIEQTFIMYFSFNQWRLQPIDIDELSEDFQKNRTRPRPLTPPEVGGNLTVASYNVLNYFNGDGEGGGFPTARGALNPSELDRQSEKLVAAVAEIDADIVGLIEMENDGGEFQATQEFVERLNAWYGDEVYDFIDTGVIGTDAIKQAFIYKPSTVELTGDYAILDTSVDPRFEDNRSRPALAQTFTEIATGEAITVTVNHFKSKGSACAPADNDPRQGNCNGVRTRASEALGDWMLTNPTGEDAVGTLIIGDINAYAEEDPISVLLDRGYVDMLKVFASEDGPVPYSFTFDATQGRLDHALADGDLAPFVTGADEWHINADETQAIDYQLGLIGAGNFRTPEVAEAYYQDGPFRSSDHDPVIIGLDLQPTVEPPAEPGPPAGRVPPGVGEKAPPFRDGGFVPGPPPGRGPR